MAIPIQKIGYNKKLVKNDQVTALLYNCRVYYRNEAQKYLVFCSGCLCGSIMAFPIPKTGYNKNSGKKGSSYDPFL